LVIATALAAVAPVGLHPAFSQDSTQTQQYQPWTGAAAQQMKNLIAELKAKIAAAESSQAASPDFLADLKGLAAKYEALQAAGGNPTGPTGPAAGTQVFADDFSDGDYTSNPAWKVSAGSWTVDRGGTYHGLVSKIRPQQSSNNLNSVLGALLQQPSNQSQNQSTFASIYTPAPIPNAFAMKVTFSSKDKQGALNLGVYQGASGSTLYRVVYQPGQTPGLSIQKVTSQGATTLGESNGAVNLEDAHPHELTLTRDGKGRMKVLVDNQVAVTARDNSLSGDMSGLLFVNSGGAYWIRSVTVTAN
jgi:hypothetical protein